MAMETLDMALLPWPYKFASAVNGREAVFPTRDYRVKTNAPLRTARDNVAGVSFSHSYRGLRRSIRNDRPVQIMCAIYPDVEDPAATVAVWRQFQELSSRILDIGEGKLWRKNPDGSEQWCWAEATDGPTYEPPSYAGQPLVMTMKFLATSAWIGTVAVTGTVDVTSSPFDFTINNPGYAWAEGASSLVFTFQALAALGFTNPSLTNNDLALTFATSRDSSSTSSVIRVDTEREAVEFNNGAGYSDDYVNALPPTDQAAIMALQSGVNSFTVTCAGTPNYRIGWSFYPADDA